MAYHNCGLCVGDSGEQWQIKRQRYGFTNSKTTRNTGWKKHRNQTTKWSNYARVIKKKQIKQQINERKIMMVVERLGVNDLQWDRMRQQPAPMAGVASHLGCAGRCWVGGDGEALTGGGSVGRSSSRWRPRPPASVAEACHHLSGSLWEDELLSQLHIGPAFS